MGRVKGMAQRCWSHGALERYGGEWQKAGGLSCRRASTLTRGETGDGRGRDGRQKHTTVQSTDDSHGHEWSGVEWRVESRGSEGGRHSRVVVVVVVEVVVGEAASEVEGGEGSATTTTNVTDGCGKSLVGPPPIRLRLAALPGLRRLPRPPFQFLCTHGIFLRLSVMPGP
jgi:hypothetical protein